MGRRPYPVSTEEGAAPDRAAPSSLHLRGGKLCSRSGSAQAAADHQVDLRAGHEDATLGLALRDDLAPSVQQRAPKHKVSDAAVGGAQLAGGVRSRQVD